MILYRPVGLVVGSSNTHRELWVPAGELEKFNRYIVGKIEVIASYYGEKFAGEIDSETELPVTLLQIMNTRIDR